LGKFLVHHEAFASWITAPELPKPGRPHSHKQKQRSAAEALTWVMGINEIKALIGAVGYELTFVKKTGKPKIGPTLAEIVSSIDDETYKTSIAPKLKNRRHHKSVIDLMKGNFDQLKQAGFYVDVQKHNSRETVGQIDRLMADRAIKLASGALYSTRVMLERFNRRMRFDRSPDHRLKFLRTRSR
jgi:hypothetical protein